MKNPALTLTALLQIGVAVGLLNVWLFRFRRATPYRGGNAQTMPEEFSLYGLPGWSCYVVGAIKVACAVLLIAGLWVPNLIVPAATVVAVLMAGALLMHAKAKDPVTKFLPALAVLLMCLFLALQ